jgi:calcineurin-like phosphoesterase family protein
MSRIYFVGDTHLGDDVIIKLENRPFASAKEQTDTIIKNWNTLVGDDDIVYVVGDFIHIGCDDYHIQKVKELKGKKYLIRGNHDTETDDFYINKCGFAKVYEHPIIIENFWILSHEPMYINKYFPYANIFGHVHGNPSYATFSSRHHCVCVERIAYFPIPFDIVKATIAEEDYKVRATTKTVYEENKFGKN